MVVFCSMFVPKFLSRSPGKKFPWRDNLKECTRGLCAFVLSQNDHRRLTSTMLKMGRKLMSGKACKKILKSVHSGADLVESYDACKHRLDDATRRAVEYVVAGQSVGNIFDVVNACLDARHGLRDAGLANPSDSALCRDLLYLDLSIADASNRAIQRGSDAVTDCQSLLELTDMVLEDLCLSLPSSNDDLLYSLISWRRIRELQRDGDASWALRAKATTDRARLAITEYAAAISDGMQHAATTIGKRCDCDTWTIDLFSEEVIRGGPAFALSLVLTRLDMYLRREANMGDWQIISPATCAGEVMHVKTLAEVMNETFKTPTVLVCDHVCSR